MPLPVTDSPVTQRTQRSCFLTDPVLKDVMIAKYPYAWEPVPALLSDLATLFPEPFGPEKVVSSFIL